MAATHDFAQLKQALMAESSRQCQLAKAHEDLQLQHSMTLHKCQRLQTEKESLQASIAAFHDRCAEETRMLRSLTETIEELASARQQLAEATKHRQECSLLKAQNELLTAKLTMQQSSAAANEKSVREQHERSLTELRGQLSAADAQHAEQMAGMQSSHKQEVAQLETQLAAERQAREEAERKLDKERRGFQASAAAAKNGGPGDAVAALKERLWALRSELEAVKSERDGLKRRCVR